MLLELKNVTKSFEEGAGDVISGVSFTLDRGQSLAVVAPSGAGKSTLLSIAGLLYAPTEGQVFIDDIDASALSDDEQSALRAEKIGFLFQHTQLVGTLTAAENASLSVDFAKNPDKQLTDDEIAERVERMLTEFGLGERMDYLPSKLSVGQKRRVATVRALFNDPALIIADEPTNDLDPENSARVVDALFARVKTGEAGLLLATHDAELAARADTVYKLV